MRDRPTIRFRTMREDDVPFGMHLKAAAGWNQTEDDWRTFIALSPEGCLVALADGEPAGTVVAVDHQGLVGWVALLLVAPEHRRRGIGTALLEEALRMLDHCETVKLDATPEGRKVYEKLGFEDEYALTRLAHAGFPPGSPSPPPPAAGVRPLREDDLERVSAFDREVSGRARGALLEAWHRGAPGYAHVAEDAGELRGFVLGRHGALREHLGPLVAPDRDTAAALLSTALAGTGGQPIFLDVFLHDPGWPAYLHSIGFTPARQLFRMFRGTNRHPGMPRLQWAASGPELG